MIYGDTSFAWPLVSVCFFLFELKRGLVFMFYKIWFILNKVNLLYIFNTMYCLLNSYKAPTPLLNILNIYINWCDSVMSFSASRKKYLRRLFLLFLLGFKSYFERYLTLLFSIDLLLYGISCVVGFNLFLSFIYFYGKSGKDNRKITSWIGFLISFFVIPSSIPNF